MPWMTLDELKERIGEETTERDSVLFHAMNAAEAMLKNYIGRSFDRATFTEYQTGNESTILVLRETPVASVISVNLSDSGFFGQGSFSAESLLTQGVDYALDLTHSPDGLSHTGKLVKLRGLWPRLSRIVHPGQLAGVPGPAYGNIKIVYVAGLEDCPEDLKAAMAQVTSLFSLGIAKGGTVKSEQLGSYSYELAQVEGGEKNPVLMSARQIAARYREPWI